ncbi:S-adenosyl-L-methionine-dependent methyltransferase [Zopfia rhizophila CBS 207.26]|uniref:Trimethylguanosine synthase n=1 Tax=Zopfia rhizophila CBS 207.26 TaxID=1314779 RepID=A0A6A6DCZ8_9PEZI|nr:S-adenosyl-L-methionine-dependent methyltransferase [Zopfia rhizophila CBS 207.26]
MPEYVDDDNPPEDTGIHHWETIAEVPEDVKKYWAQRYMIFSKYDRGIWMTEEAWFAVTPEPIANKIATHVAEAAPANKTTIIDAFAGVGGNAIAFAREGRWQQIFAIEKDPNVLECARQNAKVYGVEKKIFWIKGDCFDEINKRFSGRNDTVIFASPPWGGPGYNVDQVFNLSTMQPYSLDAIYKSFAKICNSLVLYLPRTSDLNQIAKYTPKGRKLEVSHYCLRGASKALCVYFGDFQFEGE